MAEFGLNHIPFGLRESDGAIIDAYAVSRGRRCGCICPSCQTPLIARQGEEKVWHFAYASRNVYDRTAQECDFSFYVSVRLMAWQLIGSALTLALREPMGWPRSRPERLSEMPDAFGYAHPFFLMFSGVSVATPVVLTDGRDVPSRGSVSACAQQVSCSAATMRAHSPCNRLNSATASLVFATLTSTPAARSDSMVSSGTYIRP